MGTKVLCGRMNRNMVESCQGPPCRWRALGNLVDVIEVSRWQTDRGDVESQSRRIAVGSEHRG